MHLVNINDYNDVQKHKRRMKLGFQTKFCPKSGMLE